MKSNEQPRGWHSRGYLPHFDSTERVQHVTVHLADSLPKSAIVRIDTQLECMPDQERALERRKRLHEWIDAGHGSCLLRDPERAQYVENAFFHFDGERYQLFAWVVMPNHFHVLFQPMEGWSMAKIVASWKKFTATEIKKWLRARQESGYPGNAALPSCTTSESAAEANQEIRDPGNAALPSCTTSESAVEANQEIRDPGNAILPSCTTSDKLPLWHPEYWDRYIRNEKHLNAVIDYIHNNPVKVGLCKLPQDWRFSSASKL